jgi:hypothetical protein
MFVSFKKKFVERARLKTEVHEEKDKLIPMVEGIRWEV